MGRSVQWRCPVPEPPEASLGELRTGGWNIFSRVKTPHRKHVQPNNHSFCHTQLSIVKFYLDKYHQPVIHIILISSTMIRDNREKATYKLSGSWDGCVHEMANFKFLQVPNAWKDGTQLTAQDLLTITTICWQIWLELSMHGV